MADDTAPIYGKSDGWWVIAGEFLIDLLRRAAAGEDPDLLYAEAYANSEIERPAQGEHLTCHLCDWPRPIDLDRHWHAAHLAKPEES